MDYSISDLTIRIIDIAADARLEYGDRAEEITGRQLPATELRYEVIAERDGRKTSITFHAGAKLSAEDIMAFVNGK